MNVAVEMKPLPPFTGKRQSKKCAWQRMPGTAGTRRGSNLPTRAIAAGEIVPRFRRVGRKSKHF